MVDKNPPKPDVTDFTKPKLGETKPFEPAAPKHDAPKAGSRADTTEPPLGTGEPEPPLEGTEPPVDPTAGFDTRATNPRVPVMPVREGAAPKTPAAGALNLGTPGTAEPSLDDDPAEAARVKAAAHGRVELRKVVILRDYWPLAGGEPLTAVDDPTAEDAIELPIEEARYLEESGIAQSADTYPFKAKPPVEPVDPPVEPPPAARKA